MTSHGSENAREMASASSEFESKGVCGASGIEPYITFGAPSGPFDCMILPDKKEISNIRMEAPKVRVIGIIEIIIEKIDDFSLKNALNKAPEVLL